MKVLFILILSVLLLETLQERVTKPTTHLYSEKISSKDYEFPTSNLFELTYEGFPGAFSMNLQKKVTIDGTVKYLDQDLSGSLESQEYNIESGCYSKQRYVDLDETNKIKLRVPNISIAYIDIIAIPLKNKAIALRNDFTLFEVEVQEIQAQTYVYENTDYKSFKNLLKFNESDGQILIQSGKVMIEDYDSKRVFIITEKGGISFSSENSINDDKFTFQVETIEKRNKISDVHYNQYHKLIVVASGTEGVDLYKVVNGRIEFFINLNGHKLGFPDTDLNIVDADSNDAGDMLYLLDFERGLLFIDITNINQIKRLEFSIKISKGKFFDHIDGTFMIVAKTQTFQDYCVEVFVDIKEKQYYFNRYYLNEMVIHDVQMFKDFAILVGFDAHKIIYHSIFSGKFIEIMFIEGFINKKTEVHKYFQENQLVRVDLMNLQTKSKHSEATLIGLGRGELKLFAVKSYIPQVVCYSEEIISDVNIYKNICLIRLIY